jgi:hypothetical protein
MQYSLTIFTSIFDNKTHRRMTFDTVEGFEKLLYKLSEQPGYKPKKGEYRLGSPLISPAQFNENTTRKNSNVVSWGGWAALDVDSYEGHWMDAVSIFRDVRYVCYSSASSTDEYPKFRVVFPLTCEVPAESIRHLWYALNKEYNGLGDPQTKDLSRMYYVPADYAGSKKFIFSNRDAPMINPYTLMAKHPYIAKESAPTFIDKLPESIRLKVLQHRRDGLTNTSYTWKSYHDCQFVNKNMVAEYRNIQHSGWYTQMYKIMINISSNAMKRGYPITPHEVASLCKEIDTETGGWYKSRPMELEASRAIEFSSRGL